MLDTTDINNLIEKVILPLSPELGVVAIPNLSEKEDGTNITLSLCRLGDCVEQVIMIDRDWDYKTAEVHVKWMIENFLNKLESIWTK